MSDLVSKAAQAQMGRVKDEVCQVESRNKIFIFLFLESGKTQERSFLTGQESRI